MARRNNGPINLSTKTSRARLPAKDVMYRHSLGEGRHLGYRKRKATVAGLWFLCETVVGVAKQHRRSLGASADDFEEANGTTILNFSQATQKALDMAKLKPAAKTAKGPLTVADVMDGYLEHQRLEGKPTADAELRIRTDIVPTLGVVRVDALTTNHLKKWRDALVKLPARLRTPHGQKQRYKAPPETEDALRARRASVNRTLTVLRAGLNRAFRDGLVHSDVEWRRVKPFQHVDPERDDDKFLTVAECQRLIAATDGDDRNLVMAALHSGCRYGELCNLKVKDFYNECIVVRKSKTTKTARDVELSEEAVAFFARLCAGRPAGETMLLRAGEPWGKSHQARRMKAACTKAGISPPISMHGLRHVYCSLVLQAGTPLLALARNLGHKDTRMVERVYGHLAKKLNRDIIRAGAPRFGIMQEAAE